MGHEAASAAEVINKTIATETVDVSFGSLVDEEWGRHNDGWFPGWYLGGSRQGKWLSGELSVEANMVDWVGELSSFTNAGQIKTWLGCSSFTGIGVGIVEVQGEHVAVVG